MRRSTCANCSVEDAVRSVVVQGVNESILVRTCTVLHDDVQELRVDVNRVKANNVGMTELSVVDDLSIDVLVHLWPARELLHSDQVSRLLVPHEVDDTKVPTAKLLDVLILLHLR